jgi:hypothetical protein
MQEDDAMTHQALDLLGSRHNDPYNAVIRRGKVTP